MPHKKGNKNLFRVFFFFETETKREKKNMKETTAWKLPSVQWKLGLNLGQFWVSTKSLHRWSMMLCAQCSHSFSAPTESKVPPHSKAEAPDAGSVPKATANQVPVLGLSGSVQSCLCPLHPTTHISLFTPKQTHKITWKVSWKALAYWKKMHMPLQRKLGKAQGCPQATGSPGCVYPSQAGCIGTHSLNHTEAAHPLQFPHPTIRPVSTLKVPMKYPTHNPLRVGETAGWFCKLTILPDVPRS